MSNKFNEGRAYLKKTVTAAYIEGALTVFKNGHYWRSMGADAVVKHLTDLAGKYADSILPAAEPEEVSDEG